MSHRNQPGSRIWTLFALVLSLLASVGCSALSGISDAQPQFSGPPLVTLAAPLAGDTYLEGVNVNILVRVENAGPDIGRVALLVDNQIIGEVTLPNPTGAAVFTVQNSWPAQGVGQHSIAAIATRQDGTASNNASVTITVVDSMQPNGFGNQSNPPAVLPTQVPVQPTQIPATATLIPTQPVVLPATQIPATATLIPTQPIVLPPTQIPATATLIPTNTPSVPQVRVTTGANIRSGPGTNFNPPIGSYAAGTVTNLLAVNPAGTWYKIQYFNGEGWISAGLVEVIGDISRVPTEVGPPTPIPATATPLPTNTPPPANVDLFIDGANSAIDPFPLVCTQASNIVVTVVNAGTDTSQPTIVRAQDIYRANGAVQASVEANVPALGPNQSTRITLSISVSTFINEGHTLRVRVDPDNTINETNNNNNDYTNDYTLAPGPC